LGEGSVSPFLEWGFGEYLDEFRFVIESETDGYRATRAVFIWANWTYDISNITQFFPIHSRDYNIGAISLIEFREPLFGDVFDFKPVGIWKDLAVVILEGLGHSEIR